mmetsp:Transcript_41858/g.48373  ORF Transcript_41858/g.48373 Transcript_41858/m.48373 type:complete len:200 (+) Transcript_41858:978-1577(+)
MYRVFASFGWRVHRVIDLSRSGPFSSSFTSTSFGSSLPFAPLASFASLPFFAFGSAFALGSGASSPSPSFSSLSTCVQMENRVTFAFSGLLPGFFIICWIVGGGSGSLSGSGHTGSGTFCFTSSHRYLKLYCIGISKRILEPKCGSSFFASSGSLASLAPSSWLRSSMSLMSLFSSFLSSAASSARPTSPSPSAAASCF